MTPPTSGTCPSQWAHSTPHASMTSSAGVQGAAAGRGWGLERAASGSGVLAWLSSHGCTAVNVLCLLMLRRLLLARGACFRYREMQTDAGFEGSVPPFLYGTHYSTPGYVVWGTAAKCSGVDRCHKWLQMQVFQQLISDLLHWLASSSKLQTFCLAVAAGT